MKKLFSFVLVAMSLVLATSAFAQQGYHHGRSGGVILSPYPTIYTDGGRMMPNGYNRDMYVSGHYGPAMTRTVYVQPAIQPQVVYQQQSYYGSAVGAGCATGNVVNKIGCALETGLVNGVANGTQIATQNAVASAFTALLTPSTSQQQVVYQQPAQQQVMQQQTTTMFRCSVVNPATGQTAEALVASREICLAQIAQANNVSATQNAVLPTGPANADVAAAYAILRERGLM